MIGNEEVLRYNFREKLNENHSSFFLSKSENVCVYYFSVYNIWDLAVNSG